MDSTCEPPPPTEEEDLKSAMARIAAEASTQRVSRGCESPAKPSTQPAAPTASNPPPTPLPDSHYPLILRSVRGFEERRNDLVYHPPAVNNSAGSKALVFFGGDIQDLTVSTPLQYSKYSLESTATLLHSQLPSHHLILVRPSTIRPPYSCYENFVPSSQQQLTGIPEHTANHNALMHLELLLKDLGRRLGMGLEEDRVSSTTGEVDFGRVEIAGFSKGTVVLNQLLYEFHYHKTLFPDRPPPFISTITDLYWLDGGHGGGKNTWITARPILDTLSRLPLRIHVHVTPYQLSDERRPYIKAEEKQFTSTLERMGVDLERRLWFEGDGSLEAHFRLLGEVFRGEDGG